MSKYNNILFDLDGTITDSALGITNAVVYSINKLNNLYNLNLSIPNDETLRKFIGPPLNVSFRKYCCDDEKLSYKFIKFYREDYNDNGGLFKCTLYDGIYNLIKTLLKPKGLFICSCFDGDSILESLDENKELKLKSFTIKLIKPEIESDEDAVWAKMPLPTIDETGYRAEPLALSKFINLIDMPIIDHYYPIDECDITNIENHELVDDYLRFINVYVMSNE